MMNLAISNIGWNMEEDEAMYVQMQNYGYTGLEIAPTRVLGDRPYDKLKDARIWSEALKKEYGFCIPSMQSIWYGRTERLFGTEEERKRLMEYTKKAIDFASTVKCKNLVFGCPKNRIIRCDHDRRIALDFFREAAGYALENGTVIGLEANPEIYHTNYINDTVSALELIHKVGSKGLCLNLDIGTMIQNEETTFILQGQIEYISHVHISEPFLKPIRKRDLHEKIIEMLKENDYSGYISIEMGKADREERITAMGYLASLCKV